MQARAFPGSWALHWASPPALASLGALALAGPPGLCPGCTEPWLYLQCKATLRCGWRPGLGACVRAAPCSGRPWLLVDTNPSAGRRD